MSTHASHISHVMQQQMLSPGRRISQQLDMDPTNQMTDQVDTFDYEQSAKHEYAEGNLRLLLTIECDREVLCLRYSPDCSILAAGLASGIIKIYNPEDGQCTHSLSDEELMTGVHPVTIIRFRPMPADAKPEKRHVLMATYASGMVKYWHYTSGTCIATIKEKCPADSKCRHSLTGAFNPDGTRFITAGDPQFYMYDVETKKHIATYEGSDSRDVMNGHRARVFALQYHPHDPHHFLSAGWDDTVQYWDDRIKHSVSRAYGPHVCGEALDIDPNTNNVLTGSWRKDKPLQIWQYVGGDETSKHSGIVHLKNVPEDPLHSSAIYSCQWLGREYIIAGGSDQNIVKVLDRSTLNAVGQFVDLPSGVFCMDGARDPQPQQQHSRDPPRPKFACGAATKIYILRVEKKQ